MQNSVGRELYSVKNSYRILYDGLRTIKYLLRARKSNDLNPKFSERIMLAVTEVNDCAGCSYAHSKMALEAGMSHEEIGNMLSGVLDDIPDDELLGVLFAQHYADSRGNPSKESWERIVENYGTLKAKAILGAIRVIMIGNTYGIPLGSFLNRFKGKPDIRSNLLYELSMFLTFIIYAPIALIHSLIADLFKTPLIRFEKA